MPGLAGKPFRTRETEAIDTPARFATVTTVATGLALGRVNVFTKASERYAAGHRLSTDAAPATAAAGPRASIFVMRILRGRHLSEVDVG
jgi:hypothetical protein